MLDTRITRRLAAAKGVSLHRGKLRIAFTLPGETGQTKRSLGIDPTVKNIDFAEMKLAEIRMDILRGTFSWEKHFPNDARVRLENPSLEAALETYFLNLGHWKGSSVRIAESKARRLNELFPRARLRDLTEETIVRARKQLLQECTPKHAQALMSVLQQVMTRALRAKVINDNPFLYIAPLSTVKHLEQEAESMEVEVFTLEESERLLAVIPFEATRNLVQFLLWTGIRPGEAAALRWEDWQPELRTVTIRRTRTTKSGVLQTPKTGKARAIILPLRATAALECQRTLTGDGEYVFCSGSRLCPFQTGEVIKHDAWKRWLAEAGLSYRKPYATRHTFASWMLMAGESESYVAQTLGHNSVQMVRQVYGHFIPKTSHEWTLDDPKKYELLKRQT